ncbi:MAG: cytochrome c biogenesis protein ResB [Bacteroidaceae bacterium]|nr:cytochrome c biogenesis protein ResB [Bacteroidaceae bacterium]
MWNKPWTFKEGFLIGGGLIVAGLLLELTVGPVVWDAFSWPANGLVLEGFVFMIVSMHLLRRKVYAFRFLTTYQAAIPAMCYAVVLTIVMGLTRQTVNGSWINNMLSFWPFVLIYVFMAVILGLVVLKTPFSIKSASKIVAGLFHLGLFITMTTATLGNADMQRMRMIVAKGEPEWRVMDQQGYVKEMPLAIELQEFIMETYDDGSPRRFASKIEILTQEGKKYQATVDVNKPAEVEGWKIYQYGYDTQAGAQSDISILELVSDPWLPYVYTGIFLMLGGGLLMFITGMRRKEEQA